MPKRQEIKEYNLMLQKYSVKKALIIFNRTVCNQEENLSAFILALSKRFIFLQLSNDFMLDGFAIIRLDDFDSIRHSSYERTQRKIFNSEGLLDNGFGFDKHLPLTSWTDIFKTLKNMITMSLLKIFIKMRILVMDILIFGLVRLKM